MVVFVICPFCNQETREHIVKTESAYSDAERIYGMQVSFLYSKAKKCSGIQWSYIYNKAENCKGVQIGIVNQCKTLKGIQIGLVNIIKEKGLLPVMIGLNASF